MYSTPVSVHDVAALVLDEAGPLPAFALHKIVYWCQAWSLVWDEVPLYTEPIEAWAGGPALPDLYALHDGPETIYFWPEGDAALLDAAQHSTVDAVVEAYSCLSSQRLAEIAQSELPWRTARSGLALSERGGRVIDLDEMQDYYAGVSSMGVAVS